MASGSSYVHITVASSKLEWGLLHQCEYICAVCPILLIV